MTSITFRQLIERMLEIGDMIEFNRCGDLSYDIETVSMDEFYGRTVEYTWVLRKSGTWLVENVACKKGWLECVLGQEHDAEYSISRVDDRWIIEEVNLSV